MKRPYDSVFWRTYIRPMILNRDDHECQFRLPGCTGRATAAGHIKDWRSGGAWFDPQNLGATCQACNTSERNSRIAKAARRQQPVNSRVW